MTSEIHRKLSSANKIPKILQSKYFLSPYRGKLSTTLNSSHSVLQSLKRLVIGGLTLEGIRVGGLGYRSGMGKTETTQGIRVVGGRRARV